ncbi:TetR/AcrR family tetracycline transcriptional repressor [Agromyces sp. 3263]|uniref:TetR/AcrR family transcriptional regulator n=1 Tax=Agromyces sp. 3263 TaxID=2817750 RepID=UPI00285A80CC|nr:TetR/AcrR family transcriptional regulator [Agromyces sp. 3263]MDR6905707.1 TetR/AcrR family tetracycline transcriptional repressor [Agromyces sp. 3263]
MRPGPRRSFTHAEILDAAFDLLETRGFAAVSVRGVAGSLGITPTALYTYYSSKNALLRGMIEHLLARLDLREAGGSDTVDVPDAAAIRRRIVALALRLRELLTAHAGALGLIMSGPLDGPNAMRLNETLLESFTAAGLGLDDAARAAYALQVFALGSIALESADQDADLEAAAPTDGLFPDASGTALWTDLATFPLSSRTADVAAQHNSTDQFVWGLERLLDGLLPQA